MNALGPLPAEFGATRDALAQVATHVLARRRHASTGRFGLRAGPGSIATPMFDDEILRVTATALLRERRVDDRPQTASMTLHGASLAAMAAFADVDLDAPFSVGHDTRPPADHHAPLHVDASCATIITAWFATAAEVLDAELARRPSADATAVQLWPEHFDLAVDLRVGRGRANIGASPGDAFSDQPYLYVGPWDAHRPGDDSFWNAPFGAVLGYDEVVAGGAPQRAMQRFWSRGLTMLDPSSA